MARTLIKQICIHNKYMVSLLQWCTSASLGDDALESCNGGQNILIPNLIFVLQLQQNLFPVMKMK